MADNNTTETDHVQSRSKHTLSRRQLLAAVPTSAVFVSTNVVASPSGGNASVEIVTKRKGDGTPHEKKKVPKKWLRHEEQAKRELDQIEDRYLSKNWVEAVSVGPPKTRVGGKNASVMVVEINEKALPQIDKRGDGKSMSLPDSNGIPVETKLVKDKKAAKLCVPHPPNYDYMSGGEYV